MHVDFSFGKQHRRIAVRQQQIDTHNGTHDRNDQARQHPTVPQRSLFVFIGARQQNRKDIQDDNTSCVDQQLDSSQKGIIELKIEARRSE